MKSFEYGNLIISAEQKENSFVYSWQGVSDNKELINALEPYYLDVITEAKGKKLVLDFTQLIGWMKAMSEKKLEASILYSKDSNWQKTSFRLLAGIGKGFNIDVNAV